MFNFIRSLFQACMIVGIFVMLLSASSKTAFWGILGAVMTFGGLTMIYVVKVIRIYAHLKFLKHIKDNAPEEMLTIYADKHFQEAQDSVRSLNFITEYFQEKWYTQTAERMFHNKGMYDEYMEEHYSKKPAFRVRFVSLKEKLIESASK